MIVGATHVERVCAFAAKDDSKLIVHPNGVKPPEISGERVQPISGRHFEVVEPCYGVDLIELSTHGRPKVARNAASRLTIDAVPDVPRGVIRQRPDHSIAL